MSRCIYVLLSLVIFISSCSSSSPDCVGVVSWVVDGDTIYVPSCSDVSIRFLDVDAPELGTHWGDIAHRELIDRIHDRTVALYCDGHGYYGRWLCVVEVVS